jgi:isocitrate dehydrogenase
MRHTEGFFRDWGYELAKKEFGDYTVTEQQVREDHEGVAPRGRLVVRDRTPNELFQEVLFNPEDLDVVATTNLNGHYLQSLTLAASGQVGLAPQAYVGAKAAVFEATHPYVASAHSHEQNPTSLLLCGVMLFDHLGWKDSAELVTNALMKTISDGKVTPDLLPKMEHAERVNTAEFCEEIVENFEEVRKSRVRQAMKRNGSGVSLGW